MKESEELFCESCVLQSTSQSFKKLSSFNGSGTILYGKGIRCPKCNSYVSTVWFTLCFIPILPLGSYRIKLISSKESYAPIMETEESYYSRRVPLYYSQVLRAWIAFVAFLLHEALWIGSLVGIFWIINILGLRYLLDGLLGRELNWWRGIIILIFILAIIGGNIKSWLWIAERILEDKTCRNL